MRKYKGRFLIATFILTQAFLVLIGRMWYLQIVQGDEFERFSLNNRIRLIRVPAPRGRILDRSGKEIVVNRPSFDVYVLPDDVKDSRYLAYILSPILGVEASEINDKITKALRVNRFRPALIAQDINRDQLAFIEARKSRLQAVFI